MSLKPRAVAITEIEGISLTPLKIIPSELGSVRHAMKRGDQGFSVVNEVYFSTVTTNTIKDWRKHHTMVSNLVVVTGSVEFRVFDQAAGMAATVTLGENNYQRLTISPGLWFSFKGSGNFNMICNMASEVHQPGGSEKLPVTDPQMPNLWSNP